MGRMSFSKSGGEAGNAIAGASNEQMMRNLSNRSTTGFMCKPRPPTLDALWDHEPERRTPARREPAVLQCAEQELGAPVRGTPASCVLQNLLHDAAWLRVRNAFLLAVVMVQQLRVIEPEQMQQRRVIIIRAHGIHDGLVPELVRLAVSHTALETAAGDPRAESLPVVIAPGLFGLPVVFCDRQPANLPAP